MHIVLTSNFSPWSRYSGGGQRSTHFLASALAGRGHRVTVVFTKPPWEPVQTPHGLPYRVRWAVLPALTSRRSAPLRVASALFVAGSVRALVRSDRPSIVHAQGEEGALIPRVVSCPFVLTPRYPDYPRALLRGGGTSLTRRGLWLRYAKYVALGEAARGARAVCATSRASAAQVQRAFELDETRLHVVPNGVDETYLAARRVADAARGPLLFFGRIERSKGVDVLIEAFARSAHRDRTLSIVGAGGELSWLRRRVRALGIEARVELCGWESAAQLSRRLERAALAVLPSREESFGNAMVEALAAATPLLTTSAGSLSELLLDDVTARLVPPGDASALVAAIDGLLSSPERAEALGRAGRAHVCSHYAWSTVAARYEQLYSELLGQRAPTQLGSDAAGCSTTPSCAP